MSGKQEKRKRKAAGVDLKADRGRSVELRRMHEEERRREYAREYAASLKGLIAVASRLAGSR